MPVPSWPKGRSDERPQADPHLPFRADARTTTASSRGDVRGLLPPLAERRPVRWLRPLPAPSQAGAGRGGEAVKVRELVACAGCRKATRDWRQVEFRVDGLIVHADPFCRSCAVELEDAYLSRE